MFFDIYKNLCEKNGETPNAVTLKLGFSNSTASYWKNAKNPPKREALEKIAKYFGVSVDYLLGQNDPPNAELMPAGKVRMIPVFESVSAGFGADAQNRIIDYRPTVIASDAEAAETIFVRVCGDSMHPQIQDGDLVQVHKQETAETGDIVVVLDGSEAFVKRFIHGKNGVILESANPAYPPRKYSREESNELRIVGVVRYIVRKCE
jgi:repressor LexA